MSCNWCKAGASSITPPVSPDSLSGACRDAWMEKYPRLLAQYYALCREVVSVDGVRAVPSFTRGVGSFGEGEVFESDGQCLCGSGLSSGVRAPRMLLGTFEGDGVCSEGSKQVDSEEVFYGERQCRGDQTRHDSMSRVERTAQGFGHVRDELHGGGRSKEIGESSHGVLGEPEAVRRLREASATVAADPDNLIDHRLKKHEKRRRQKEKRKIAIDAKIKGDWRNKDGGDMIKQDQSPGTFWNSTSSQVRQELIDSKARMHIAENKRREREALDKIAYLESPEAAMHKAISMIDYAQKQAKKENDNKVYGWAKTVATSSAESLARSTPDSVPSFDEVSARIEASSQSSFELELKAKQDELDDERRKNALLENEIREEKKAKEEVVAKSKHEAVVHRMRQLETQISENNKKAERVNFRRNRVEEMRNAQGETEKQMRARMAKLSPEEHQREVVRLMRERAWENS